MTLDERSLLARLSPRHVVWMAALSACVAFGPSLLDGFVFDDAPLIVKNPYAHDLRYLGRCFTTDLWDTPDRPDATASVRFYRPVVCASYVLGWKLGGGTPWTFHLTNVLLHAGTSALAARLALRWTGSAPAALLSALVFAVHPSRSENVVWVSGRTDLLMGLFLLAAHEAARMAARRTRAAALFATSTVSWVLAVLSKEFAVCWPFLLLVEVVLVDPAREPGTRRKLTVLAGVATTASALYLAARAAWFPIRPPEIEGMALPFPLNVAYSLLSFGYYVERTVAPWPQTFHFRPVAIEGGRPELFAPSVAVGALAAVGLAVWLALSARRDRARAAAIATGTVVLLPVLNVSYTGFPGTTADRFLYLPLLPFAVAAARHGARAIERWFSRSRIAPLVVLSGSFLLCGVNWVRCLDYVSDETVWRHELELNPENPQALAGLAQFLAEHGEADDAFGLLRRALAPGALGYGLLAKPTRYYLGLLELHGPRLADGNVTALEALLGELVTLVDGRIPEGPLRSGDLEVRAPTFDEHFPVHLANGRTHLAAAAAMVASRLGHDDLVRRLVPIADGEGSLDPAGRYNLALALARADDTRRAREELGRARAGSPDPAVTAGLERFEKTLIQVEDLRAAARAAPEPLAALGRATAYFELGAYLRAARELRSSATRDPRSPVIPLYVRALTSARLDADATAAAAGAGDPTQANALLQEARAQLSERTRRAVLPQPGERWW